MDDLDRQLIVATQQGLPLVAEPYQQLARSLGTSSDEVTARLQRMLDSGVIRRIAAVPNHYKLGYRANGMTVWDIPDALVASVGPLVAELDFVSHCYQRPRHLPDWPYNLFAMVHGHDRREARRHYQSITDLLGERCHNHQILFSTRILKKSGFRIAQQAPGDSPNV
jgi:DNA-binding Lrp family transcriptional regulator